MTFTCRRGLRADAEPIADLMLEADGGTLQFVLDDLAPEVSARDLLLHMIKKPEEYCSYRNCEIVETDSTIVGIANAFPADRLLRTFGDAALTAREAHLQARTELQDWGSYLLNSIAVHSSFRRLGIGLRLIEDVAERARAEGFDRLSLHVWRENVGALAFYRSAGFTVLGHARVVWHPALPYQSGSLLLCRPLRRKADHPQPFVHCMGHAGDR